jgi:hypothetical protein
MNRTLVLLLVVVLLGAGAYFFIGKNQGKPISSVVGADREFAVPRADIQKIFIADRSGHKTTLTRADQGWIYNGAYKARPDAVENLLLAIENVRMRSKPTQSMVPNMIESLSTNGLKVEIYGKNDELIKAYYLGGATNDELGTYIILEGAEQPYVADIPNWQGNIRFRYNLTDDDWRDRTVFASKAADIATVSIEYPKQQAQSFRLDVTGAEPVVTPFYELSSTINKAVKPGKVEAFLDNFSSIIAVGFNNLNREREKIVQQVPFAIITLKEKNGKTYSVTLFPQDVNTLLDPKTGVSTTVSETTGFFALTQDNDFMVMQNVVLRRILWGYEFFF